jgi:hypothetical protein
MQSKLLMAITAALLVVSASALAKNGPPGASPSATAAGALTVVSANSFPGPNNQVVATLPVTGTTDDGGGNDIVCATIFDDGSIRVSQCLTVAVGATQTLTFTLNWTGPILTGAPGVGLYTNDATSAATPTTGASLGVVDPLFLALTSPVPTLSEWSLLLMATLVLLVGVALARRRGHGPPTA